MYNVLYYILYNMTIDIFIRTYSKDYFLLKYSLISITKFIKGYRYIHICSREKDYNELLKLIDSDPLIKNNNKIKTHKTHDFPDNIDYCGQQIIKMYADIFSDAEYICYTDSDTIYYNEINLEHEFIDNFNKINLFVDVWDNVGDANCWKKCLKTLNLLTDYEFMRRLPIVIPSCILKEIRVLIEKKIKKDFINSCLEIYNNEGISEFNIMSSYMYLFYEKKCNIKLITEEKKLPILQLWSHSDKNELIYQINKVLNI
jgi:hypothetical protein